MAVLVMVVGVSLLLLEIITTVNQDIMALVTLQAYTPVMLSGMVQGVRVKVVAAALLHVTVDLVNSTSDDIEVRICADTEDTPICLLELYIQ